MHYKDSFQNTLLKNLKRTLCVIGLFQIQKKNKPNKFFLWNQQNYFTQDRIKNKDSLSICSFTILGPKQCIWLRLVIQYYKVVVKIVAYDWRGRGPGDEGAGN